ncbi:MAG: hypothetical protein ACKVKH_05285, partial [Verrucomicrobiales bacterium]
IFRKVHGKITSFSAKAAPGINAPRASAVYFVVVYYLAGRPMYFLLATFERYRRGSLIIMIPVCLFRHNLFRRPIKSGHLF